MVNNVTSHFFIPSHHLELRALQEQNNFLTSELNGLIDFQNNLRIEADYILTNSIRSNNGFNNLIINGGNYHIGDEVINSDGLVGMIAKVRGNISEVQLLHQTNIVVNINDENGKIVGSDEEGNLIVREISNYNNINLNDRVYSMMGTYIGRVIHIRYEIIDNFLTVSGPDRNNLHFLGVIKN